MLATETPAAAGTLAAFAGTSERYRAPLRAYCVQIVGSAHADDVVQQTMLKAWRALTEDGTEVADLRAWLYGIARNQAMDFLRNPRRSWEELDGGSASPESIEVAAETRDRLSRVMAGIGELPARQRVALVKHAVDGDSYAEIAATMHTNEAAVGQLIVRARARLRELPAVFLPAALFRRVVGASQKCGWLSGGKAAVVVVALGGGAVPLLSFTPGPAHHQSPQRTPPALAAQAAPRATATFARATATLPRAGRPGAARHHASRSEASSRASGPGRGRTGRNVATTDAPRAARPVDGQAQTPGSAAAPSPGAAAPGPTLGLHSHGGLATVSVPVRAPVPSVPSPSAVVHAVPQPSAAGPDLTPEGVAAVVPGVRLP